jgi:CubicO group peptidase (beta-lactamase class C family)
VYSGHVRTRIWLLVLVTSACGGSSGVAPLPAAPPAPPSPVAAPASKQVEADTPGATTGGATFTIPAGWSMLEANGRVILEPPEKDLRLAILELEATGSDEAIELAWKTLDGEMTRSVRLKVDLPARSGWSDRHDVIYETSPSERRVIRARALRREQAWTVLLLDGAEATAEKRGSPILLIESSLRPKGYTRETFAGRSAHKLDAARLAELQKFIVDGQKVAGVPGVALALVQDGKVVFAGGFGVRELGKPAKITADTYFQIASNTKQLTTLLLAKLVDEGRFGWDSPVTEIYPAFKLGDPDTTRRVLVRHLVCACTGLPRQDLEWIFEFRQRTPKSTLELLATHQPTSGFGEVYQYSNPLASAGGYVGAYALYPDRELGAAYDEAMRRLVFAPLGMRATTFDMDRALRGNVASPHAENVNGRPTVAAQGLNRSIVPMRPAGGGWSTVRDLARVIQMELALGIPPGGKRYLSEATLLERRVRNVDDGEDTIYGMGLAVERRWGIPVVRHGGSMVGYRSDLFFLPEHGVGGVILTNADSGWILLEAFERRLVEVLFDGDQEAVEDLAAAAVRRRQTFARDLDTLVLPPDPEAVTRLSSRYESLQLGRLTVIRTGVDLIFDFDEWQSGIATRRNDDGTTSFVTIAPGINGLELFETEEMRHKALVVRGPQHEYVFIEAPVR